MYAWGIWNLEFWNLYRTCIHGFMIPIGFLVFAFGWIVPPLASPPSLANPWNWCIDQPRGVRCFFQTKTRWPEDHLGQHQDKTGEAKMLLGNSGQTEMEVDLSCKFTRWWMTGYSGWFFMFFLFLTPSLRNACLCWVVFFPTKTPSCCQPTANFLGNVTEMF